VVGAFSVSSSPIVDPRGVLVAGCSRTGEASFGQAEGATQIGDPKALAELGCVVPVK